MASVRLVHRPHRLHRALPVCAAVCPAGLRSGARGERSTSMVPAAAAPLLPQRTTSAATISFRNRHSYSNRVQPGTLHRGGRAPEGVFALSEVDADREVILLRRARLVPATNKSTVPREKIKN